MTQPPSQSTTDRNRFSLAPALLAGVPFLLLALAHWNEQPSVFSGDWAQYILHARALADGRSYGDIGYLYSPLAWTIGPRAYPPGLSLTILPLLTFGEHAMAAMRVLMIVSALGFLVMAARRLSYAVHPALAALAVGWCGVMLELDRASVQVLSDLGFCFFCWWVLAEVDAPEEWNNWRIVRVVMAGFGAMAYRVVGVAVPVAVFLYLFLAPPRHRRPLLVVLGIWGLCGLAVLAVAPQLIPRQFLASGLPSLGAIAEQLKEWRHPISEAQGYPFGPGMLSNIYHLVATLLTLVGAIALLRRNGRSALPMLAVVYAVVLLAVRVFDIRYFWPLFPVIVAAQLEGTLWLLRRVGLAAESVQLRTVATLSLVLAGTVVWRDRSSEVVAGFEAHADAKELMEYARQSVARGESPRFLFANPRVLTLETGVPAMGLVTAKPSVVMRELIRLRITHVVVGAFRDGCGLESVIRTRQAYPASFEAAARFGRFEVVRLAAPDSSMLARPAVDDVSPAEGGACSSSDRWLVEPAAP